MQFEESTTFLPKHETPTPRENVVVEETSVERAEQIYIREVVPILRVLKPEGLSDEDYETSVMDDLLEEVKNVQVLHGKRIADPVTTMRGVKDLLNRKIKNIVRDASGYAEGRYKKPKTVDAGLVRRAKIALLVKDTSRLAARSIHCIRPLNNV